MTIETYPEMNAKIVDLLRWDKDNSMLLYAAQYIEELEAEVEWLQHELELHKELYVFSENDMGMMKAQRDGARDACASYREKIERLHRELHDEQVRRNEWEKMYNRAIAEPIPNTLPCGHPRSAMRSDGAAHWCTECEKEAKG